jgi:hypothetical protein
LLIYAEEDSPGAVANRLGLSAAATWTLLSRARSRLRLQLEQTGFVPALVMSRPRIRALLAAGAAAGVATTMAVTPIRPPAATPSEEVAKPKIVQVDAPKATKTVAPKAKSKPLLPVATEDVTSKVDDAVADAKAVPERVRLGACIGPADEIDVGVELWPVEEQKETLVGTLRTAVDDTVGLPEAATCN